ncbi:MAG TPA: hypothetical protein VGC44_07205 [Longimicrobiales bacterium]
MEVFTTKAGSAIGSPRRREGREEHSERDIRLSNKIGNIDWNDVRMVVAALPPFLRALRDFAVN